MNKFYERLPAYGGSSNSKITEFVLRPNRNPTYLQNTFLAVMRDLRTPSGLEFVTILTEEAFHVVRRE